MMNKTQLLKRLLYLVGLHIYYKMIHGPYNIKFFLTALLVSETVYVSIYLSMNNVFKSC